MASSLGDHYLDYSATWPMLPTVAAALRESLTGGLANPSSVHFAGRHAAQELHASRFTIADALAVEPNRVILTSGGTEANNLAVHALAELAPADRRHVVTSAIEHPAVLASFDRLRRQGFEVETVAPSPDGLVCSDAMLAAVRAETAFCALMLVNNETGVLQPAAEIAEALRHRSVPVCIDAVAALGRVDLDPALRHASAVALSAHKIGGPSGIGALVVEPGTRWPSLLSGGQQEGTRRPGTENLLGAVGFAAAMRELPQRLAEAPQVALQRDRLELDLGRRVGAVPIGSTAPRGPQISSLRFPGASSERLLGALSERGVCAASGPACHAGARRRSHVLRAMQVSATASAETLRFSLGPPLADPILESALDRIAAAVEAVTASPRNVSE